jgi:hypothetical protein
MDVRNIQVRLDSREWWVMKLMKRRVDPPGQVRVQWYSEVRWRSRGQTQKKSRFLLSVTTTKYIVIYVIR